MNPNDKYQYWVDLQRYELAEDTNTGWMQAFPIGEYKHPAYGKISMTFDRAKNFARGVIQKVRGIDIAIDYAHESGGEAAGWVKSAEARKDGLWLFVEWTQEAADSIRAGKWRYFSPEFMDEWTRSDGQKFKDVLLGGGLTNRPFLKNILPVNLSEVLGEDAQPDNEGGEQVEELLKLLREKLSLAEDADEDAIIAALDGALQQGEESDNDDPPETLSEEELSKLLAENAAMAAVIDQNKKLAEQNKALVGRVVNLEATNREAGVKAKLSEWHQGGLPTALDEKVTAFMLSISEKQAKDFGDIFDDVVKKGLVPLDEKGGTRKRKTTSTDPTEAMEKRVKELMEGEDGLSYADAVATYFAENDDAYEGYLANLAEGEED